MGQGGEVLRRTLLLIDACPPEPSAEMIPGSRNFLHRIRHGAKRQADNNNRVHSNAWLRRALQRGLTSSFQRGFSLENLSGNFTLARSERLW